MKWNLEKVRLNLGGYDRSGRYWGGGRQLWSAWTDNGDIEHFRASDRDSAKAMLRMIADKDATFYR